MLDFPNSPSLGQNYTSGGKQWTWDGTKWLATSATAGGAGGGYQTGPGLAINYGTTPPTIDVTTPYLPLTGGTVTGNLTVGSGATSGFTPRISVVDPLNAYLSIKGGTTSPELYLGSDSNDFGIIGTFTNHGIAFRTNNTLKMFLSALGGLSVGLTSDAGAGNILAAGSIEATNGAVRAGTSLYVGPSGTYASIDSTGCYFQKPSTFYAGIAITATGTLNTPGITLNTASGLQASLLFQASGTNYWSLGRDTDNAFFIYNNTTGVKSLSITTGGDLLYHAGIHNFSGFGSTLFAQFDVGGTRNISGSWITISDLSIKQDVEPYERGLDAIAALNPISYRLKPGAPFYNPDRKEKLHGLVAQDVRDIIPEMVSQSERENLASLEPGHLVFVLVNAVKELKQRLETLEAKG